MPDSIKAGLWVSPDFLADQITELKELQYMIRYSIKEGVVEKKNWSDEGMLILMFEYYSCVTNQLKILYDVLVTKPKLNQKIKGEEYFINSENLSMLLSLTSLASVNELSLRYDHRISFTVH